MRFSLSRSDHIKASSSHVAFIHDSTSKTNFSGGRKVIMCVCIGVI